LIGPRLCEHLLRGLLVAADHQHGERLTAPGRAAAPKAIQQVIDAIHDGPERPYTVGSLAELAGVSTRSLQEGFRRHVGASPMVYLRDVRLARVHEDLRQTPLGAGGVAEVAYRWGFAHLGRFAAQYQAKYGVTPSHTLRAG
jgi:transcriptional regulator GlxA family with amidase domain